MKMILVEPANLVHITAGRIFAGWRRAPTFAMDAVRPQW